MGVRQENSIKTSVWTIKQGKTTTVQVDSTLWTCWHLDSFGPWTLSTSLSLHGFYFKHVLLCLRRTFCYFKLVPTQLHTHIKKKSLQFVKTDSKAGYVLIIQKNSLMVNFSVSVAYCMPFDTFPLQRVCNLSW